jgi:hypothetical protein
MSNLKNSLKIASPSKYIEIKRDTDKTVTYK